MDFSTGSRREIPIACAVAVAVAYFGIALLQGGYGTTAVAWGTIVVWAIVGLGIALRLWPKTDLPVPAVAAGACLAGLAGLSVLSLIWANDGGRAFSAALLPAGYTALFALVVLAAPATGSRSWLLGLAAGTTLTTVAALMSRLDPGFLGAVDHGAAFLPGSQGRLSYPIGYWNGLAACVAAGVVLLTWLGAGARTRMGRAAAVGLIPLGGLALFLTSSRGGIAAALIGVAAVMALGPKRPQLLAGALAAGIASVLVAVLANGQHALVHNLGSQAQTDQGLEVGGLAILAVLLVATIRWSLDAWLLRVEVAPRVRRLGVATAAVGAVAVVALVAFQLRDFSSTGATTSTPQAQRSFLSGSGSGREQFWEVALEAYASQPVTGVGAGNYDLYWNAHPKLPLVTGNAHSYFLEALADLGPVGLLLAVGPFAAAIVAVRTRLRNGSPELAAAFALMLAGGFGAAIDWTWKIPAAFAPTLIAIALLTCGAAAGRWPRPGLRGSKRIGGFGLGVATLLFAWGAIFSAGLALIASNRLSTSRDAVTQGDLAAAASDARAAASVEPFSPEPELQLALVDERAGDLRRAGDAAEEAISKASDDWRGYALLARIATERGETAAGLLAAGRAQSLSPVPLPPSVFKPRHGRAASQ
jgi:hypothetical protein